MIVSLMVCRTVAQTLCMPGFLLIGWSMHHETPCSSKWQDRTPKSGRAVRNPQFVNLRVKRSNRFGFQLLARDFSRDRATSRSLIEREHPAFYERNYRTPSPWRRVSVATSDVSPTRYHADTLVC
jgi:hypothetical protein